MARGTPLLVLTVLAAAWSPTRADTPPLPAPPGAPAPVPAAPEPPPAPPGPKPAPILVPDKTEQDYGIVAQNQKIDAQFVLRNVGTVPVRIHKPIADCGCYQATVEAPEVAPGGEVKVSVKFDTGLWSGRLEKKLRIQSSDPGRPELVLPLKMDIVAGVVLDPGRVVFGEVLRGETPSRSIHVKWYEGIGTPFRVTGVEVVPAADEEVAVAQEPWSHEKWKGTKVTVTFKKAPPLGQFSRTLIVRTDAPGYERIDVTFQADVSGYVWVQERSVNMGWATRGQPKSRTIRVKPLRGANLGNVTVRARGEVLKVEATPDAGDRPGWWLVRIEIPPTAPPGKLTDVLELRTEVKGEEVTEIPVKAEIVG